MTVPTLIPHDYRALTTSPWARIAAGSVVFMAAGLSASSDDGIVLCPFRRCTGGYCPGCGLTRSAGSLIRGDIVRSWSHHPFLLVGLLQLAVAGAVWTFSSSLWSKFDDRRNWLLGANLTLLGAIWIARLVTGSIPLPFVG